MEVNDVDGESDNRRRPVVIAAFRSHSDALD
jgi:hypothetical protein